MHVGTGSYRHNNVVRRCVTETYISSFVIMQYDMMHEDLPNIIYKDTKTTHHLYIIVIRQFFHLSSFFVFRHFNNHNIILHHH